MTEGIAINFPFETGWKIGYSLRQVASGLLWDLASSSFIAAPPTPVYPLVEGSGPFAGGYSGGLAGPLPVAFADGHYSIGIHFLEGPMTLIDAYTVTVHSLSGGPVFPFPLSGQATMTMNVTPATPIAPAAPVAPTTSTAIPFLVAK